MDESSPVANAQPVQSSGEAPAPVPAPARRVSSTSGAPLFRVTPPRRVCRRGSRPLAPSDVTLADFIDERILKPGQELILSISSSSSAATDGVEDKAWLTKDGWVADEADETHPTVDQWLAKATKRHGMRAPPSGVDSWTRVRAKDRTLADLRDAYVAWRRSPAGRAGSLLPSRKRRPAASQVSGETPFDTQDARFPELDVATVEDSEDPPFVPPSHTEATIEEPPSATSRYPSTVSEPTAKMTEDARGEDDEEVASEGGDDTDAMEDEEAQEKERARRRRKSLAKRRSSASKRQKTLARSRDEDEPSEKRRSTSADDVVAASADDGWISKKQAEAESAKKKKTKKTKGGKQQQQQHSDSAKKNDDEDDEEMPPAVVVLQDTDADDGKRQLSDEPAAAAAAAMFIDDGATQATLEWISKKPAEQSLSLSQPAPKAAPISDTEKASVPTSQPSPKKKPISAPAAPASPSAVAIASPSLQSLPAFGDVVLPSSLDQTLSQPPRPHASLSALSSDGSTFGELLEVSKRQQEDRGTAASTPVAAAAAAQPAHAPAPSPKKPQEEVSKPVQKAPLPPPPAASLPPPPPPSPPRAVQKPPSPPRQEAAAAAAIEFVAPPPMQAAKKPNKEGGMVAAAGPRILSSNLKSELLVHLNMAIKKIGGTVAEAFAPEAVTHVVLDADENNRARVRTTKLAQGIATGKWVVSFKWVLDSFGAGRWLDETPYEITSDPHCPPRTNSARTGRQRAEAGDPPLFSGHRFFISPTVDAAVALGIAEVIAAGGGEVLRYTPPAPSRVDEVLDGAGATTHVLAPPATTVEQAKLLYLQCGRRPLSHDWPLDCVSHYKLLPTRRYELAIAFGDELAGLATQHSLAY